MNDPVIIQWTDLPECRIVELAGEHHVDCGSDWGTWNVQHLNRIRKTALEYVAAWQAAEGWRSKQATLARERNKRRDELARDIHTKVYGPMSTTPGYANSNNALQEAIDRIIALEQAA